MDPADGRPSKLTEQLIGDFSQMLLTGAPMDDVCAYFGIARETFRLWLKQGRDAETRWLTLGPKERVPFTSCHVCGCSESAGKSTACKRGSHEWGPSGLHHAFLRATQKGLVAWRLEALARMRQAAIGRTITKTVRRTLPDGTVEETTTTQQGVGAQWTADAWRLERRVPHDYGQRTETAVAMRSEVQEALVKLLRGFGHDRAALRKALESLAEQSAGDEVDIGAMLAQLMSELPPEPAAPTPAPAAT